MIMKAENVSKRYFRKTGSANYFLAVSPLSLELGGGEFDDVPPVIENPYDPDDKPRY